MPSLFAITTATDKLRAETGGAATVFTVTNTTSRPLRGIAKIKPLGNTQAQWLKIDGESERDFPAGGTHQFTVSFNRPQPPAQPNAAQPAESFPFRLDAISAVNPDEDFTEGPIVTVEIPERKVEEKKPFPWWLVVVGAAVLLIIGFAGVWLMVRNSGGDVEVPDVTNKTFAEANSTLANVNLKAVKVDVVANDKEINKVFEQDPTAGSKVDANSSVNLSLPATVIVPRLIGLKFEEAKSQLSEKGLEISNPIQSRDVPKSDDPNLIGFQFPLPNTTALKGSEVKIFVPCRGLRCLGVRDIVGEKVIGVDTKTLVNSASK